MSRRRKVVRIANELRATMRVLAPDASDPEPIFAEFSAAAEEAGCER
jgi:hypothetical protein